MGLIMNKPAIKVVQINDGRWTKPNSFTLEQTKETLDAVSRLVQKGAMKDLNDFDNYLDNIKNDYLNDHFNKDLPQLMAMY